MDRFLSNSINKVDKKGRVSIPASFRPSLKGSNKIYARLSVDHPAVDVGGEAFLQAEEDRLAEIDPFSPEYEAFSMHIHGDTFQLTVDAEGRVIVSDAIAQHCGIKSEIAFVGRGRFFQIWEPSRLEKFKKRAQARVSEMRKGLSGQVSAGGGAKYIKEQGV